MEQIDLASVDTPGFFASIIRRVIGIPYVHVVLSMDADLERPTVWVEGIRPFR